MDDPEVWATLGRAIRADRERQGLTREQLADRVRARGVQVSSRSIGTLEEGPAPKRRTKRPTLEPTVAALGWQPGWTDRILQGEDPSFVLQGAAAAEGGDPSRAHLLELVPGVYEFSRTAAGLGAPSRLRDNFDELVQEILAAVKTDDRSYTLAAYRPHSAGEGVPVDDAARIRDALNR
ncbi:hypothetical protein [Streptomyces sp. NBC_00198]|uniref:hypothetical protein n=1 Tax=Streptomyces sp. NBC_00198 TaxID=2975677 RepID=UPI002258E4F4|nr:hypothetical protein [Streptomyces sp. NBC_00198]MCX5285986.1 hypothetical protein [Streptomyces sp. NBC_00198]MCX5286295.1 hypothetical protein [Streptomyces sp. NBC_00198]